MSNTNRLLLTCISVGIVCSAAVVPDTSVLYKNVRDALKHTESVFIHGKAIALDEWSPPSPPKKTAADSASAEDTIKMYAFVKCECAFFIMNSVDIIDASVGQCPVDRSSTECAAAADNKRAIPDLDSLDETVRLTVTVLFELRDAFPAALRSGESNFLRTLLATSLYVDSLKSARDHRDDPQRLQTALMNMKRVLLQIVTLVDQFSLENCLLTARHYHRHKHNATADLQLQLDELCEFLTRVVPLDMRDPHSVIGKGRDLLLEKCVRPEVSYGNGDLKRFCDEYLTASRIRTKDLGEHVTLSHLLSRVYESNDLESAVYEYMHAVYDVVLKLTYLVTQRHLEQYKLGSSLNVAKLRSMNIPMEMIDNFEIVSRVERYGDDTLARAVVEEILAPKANGMDDVRLLRSGSQLRELSLSDLTADLLTAVELKHFWRAFDLLRGVRARKSPRVYDMSVDLIAENRMGSRTEKDEKNCEALVDVYVHCFNVETALCHGGMEVFGEDRMLLAQSLSTIIPYLNGELHKGLLGKLNEWIDTRNVSVNDDLYKIMSAKIISLNAAMTDHDRDHDDVASVDQLTTTDLSELIIGKRDKSVREIRSFLNRLDHYHVRNCRVVKNSYSVHENEYNEKLKEYFNRNEYRNVYGFFKKTASSDDDDDDDDISFGKTDSYDFEKFADRQCVMRSGSLGSGIKFRWRGETKSIREILDDVSANMSDMQDLVDYRTVYARWTIYVYYKAWFTAFERTLRQGDNKVDEAFRWLSALNEITLPGRLKKFSQYFAWKYRFFRLVHAHGKCGRGIQNTVDCATKEIIIPMSDVLDVVSDDDGGFVRTDDDVLEFLKIDNDDALSPAEVTKKTFGTIEKKLLFLESENID